MPFSVKDLMISFSGPAGAVDEAGTCTGWTVPTSCKDASLLVHQRQGGAVHGLGVLKAELRQAVQRS